LFSAFIYSLLFALCPLLSIFTINQLLETQSNRTKVLAARIADLGKVSRPGLRVDVLTVRVLGRVFAFENELASLDLSLSLRGWR